MVTSQKNQNAPSFRWRPFLGGMIVLLFGSALSTWIFINLFVELQPEASKITPAPAVFFSFLMVWKGAEAVSGRLIGDWLIWKYRLTYWFLFCFFIVFGAAYAVNVGRRIGALTVLDLVAISGFVADGVFFLLFSRITFGLIRALLNENDD